MKYTSWPSLVDSKAGELIEATWDDLFDRLADEPPPFAGSQRHPGWSPAVFAPCQRLLANVTAVYALVLDYDAGSTSIEDAFRQWGDFYGLLHTTRSHTAERPRFRVILPFTRSISRDEYGHVWAWANAVARSAGQELDQAPKDPSRFWYLPSRVAGVDYVVNRLRGEPIDPTPILSRAAAPAPTLPRLRVVGPDQTERRASLYLGRMDAAVSGQNGHQALWRAAVAMVRGFNLDRATALGLLRSEYSPRCSPPWSDRELEHKVDSAARATSVPEGYLLSAEPVPASPATPLPDDPGPAPAQVRDWRADLRVRSDGSPLKTYGNTYLIVSQHEPWRGRWALNEMTGGPTFDREAVSETMPDVIRRRIEQDFGYSPPPLDIDRAIGDVAALSPYHPVREYLTTLTWDGQARIAHVAAHYLGTDEALRAEMVRRWFVGAVARALDPGCKLDTALVLVGPQGWRKSSFFAALASPWFSDSQMDVESTDGKLQLHSAWVHEWGELENVVNERRESQVKQFLSSQVDNYRAPYGRTNQAHKRSSVIVGSTNHQRFLTDVSGSRRYWVVPVLREVDVAGVARERDQLWAEAVVEYRAGVEWWLGRDTEAEREREAENYRVEDSWSDVIDSWLRSRPKSDEITTWRVLNDALHVETAKQGRQEQMRVAKILRGLGWLPVIEGTKSERKRVWQRGG